MSSDHSDSEELELWARTVDLPGFDDNVSPHNAITMLLRFVVGEVGAAWCWCSLVLVLVQPGAGCLSILNS